MKLAISNIAWDSQANGTVYHWMQEFGFTGLEIAPTKIIAASPYEQLNEAKQWSEQLKETYGFVVPSMQSIWYGRPEKLFGTAEERFFLLEYTKKAIRFASTIGCGNLVFGCPKNRQKPEEIGEEIELEFFYDIGEYAKEHGTTIGMEANPPIYQTNYINDTVSALKLVRKVNSRGFLLNLDVGTMIENEETVDILKGQISYVSHVHISEPWLKPIVKRSLHQKLIEYLKQEDYSGFLSIEMGNVENIDSIEQSMVYIQSII